MYISTKAYKAYTNTQRQIVSCGSGGEGWIQSETGYNNTTDELYELSDIVTINKYKRSKRCITQVQPYRVYQELGNKIKQAPVCERKQFPVVKINMGFSSKVAFN